MTNKQTNTFHDALRCALIDYLEDAVAHLKAGAACPSNLEGAAKALAVPGDDDGE